MEVKALASAIMKRKRKLIYQISLEAQGCINSKKEEKTNVSINPKNTFKKSPKNKKLI